MTTSNQPAEQLEEEPEEEGGDEPVAVRAARLAAGLCRLANDDLACQMLAVQAALSEGVPVSFVDDPIGYIASGVARAIAQSDAEYYGAEAEDDDTAAGDGESAATLAATPTGTATAGTATAGTADDDADGWEWETEEEEEAPPELAYIVALLRLHRTIRGGTLSEAELAAGIATAMAPEEGEEEGGEAEDDGEWEDE